MYRHKPVHYLPYVTATLGIGNLEPSALAVLPIHLQSPPLPLMKHPQTFSKALAKMYSPTHPLTDIYPDGFVSVHEVKSFSSQNTVKVNTNCINGKHLQC